MCRTPRSSSAKPPRHEPTSRPQSISLISPSPSHITPPSFVRVARPSSVPQRHHGFGSSRVRCDAAATPAGASGSRLERPRSSSRPAQYGHWRLAGGKPPRAQAEGEGLKGTNVGVGAATARKPVRQRLEETSEQAAERRRSWVRCDSTEDDHANTYTATASFQCHGTA